MNNRFVELAYEAKLFNGEQAPFDEVKKFAELIVRECADVGSQWADGLIDTKHYAFVNKKIKEHFGVEE